mmetsp:Transcript_44133/g.73475  ORF Transcript_44133/g.73475 Transcript_44133/m.73475 type:complete len:105 (-) Transcript_44133:92-406(-)
MFPVAVVLLLWYVRKFEDPFLHHRDKSHNPNDPDQEIHSNKLIHNPAWRGKLWNGLTYDPTAPVYKSSFIQRSLRSMSSGFKVFGRSSARSGQDGAERMGRARV